MKLFDRAAALAYMQAQLKDEDIYDLLRAIGMVNDADHLIGQVLDRNRGESLPDEIQGILADCQSAQAELRRLSVLLAEAGNELDYRATQLGYDPAEINYHQDASTMWRAA